MIAARMTSQRALCGLQPKAMRSSGTGATQTSHQMGCRPTTKRRRIPVATAAAIWNRKSLCRYFIQEFYSPDGSKVSMKGFGGENWKVRTLLHVWSDPLYSPAPD